MKTPLAKKNICENAKTAYVKNKINNNYKIFGYTKERNDQILNPRQTKQLVKRLQWENIKRYIQLAILIKICILKKKLDKKPHRKYKNIGIQPET